MDPWTYGPMGPFPILYEFGPDETGRSMMVWLGLLSAVALTLALVSLASARRLRRRLEQLQQSYWDLRYEHGRLKAQVKRLDPEASPETAEPGPAASTTFIPLSSLKR